MPFALKDGSERHVADTWIKGSGLEITYDSDGLPILSASGGGGGEPTEGWVEVGDADTAPVLASRLSFQGNVLTVDPVTDIATFNFDGRYVQIGGSIPWSQITSRPTTLNGYGILDAYTRTQLQTPGSSSFAAENLTGSIADARIPSTIVRTDHVWNPLRILGGHTIERERAGNQEDLEIWHGLNTNGRANAKFGLGTSMLLNVQATSGNALQLWRQEAGSGALLYMGLHTGGSSDYAVGVDYQSWQSNPLNPTVRWAIGRLGHFENRLPATTDWGFATRLIGDVNPRFIILSSGMMGWGTGASNMDVTLYRDAGILRTGAIMRSDLGFSSPGFMRSDEITEYTLKDDIRRPYASIYVGIPTPTGLRDGTLWIVPGGSPGGGGGPSGPVLWSDIEGTPTTLSGYGILDAYTQTQLSTSGQATVHGANLTGVASISDSLLSANIARRNAANSFTGAITIATGAGTRLDVGAPTTDFPTVLLGRRTNNPSIKSTDAYLIAEGGGTTGHVSLNHYATGNVILAFGGGGVGIRRNSVTAGYALDINGSFRWTDNASGNNLEWTGIASGATLRSDTITESTLKGGIRRPYASIYVGIPAPTGLRDGTLWIVPGGSSGGGGGPSGPVLWADIEGKPTTLSGFGITDALPANNPVATGSLTVAQYAHISVDSPLIGSAGNDVLFRNIQGTGWQELRITDDQTDANRGIMVRVTSNSGTDWSEVFRVTGNHLRWKGADIATQTWADNKFALGAGFTINQNLRISDDPTFRDLYVSRTLRGGIGANTTGGTVEELDWDHVDNARSGSGLRLLRGSHPNGPTPLSGSYYHPFAFEYSTKTGGGNMTQFAIPYSAGLPIHYRSRFSGSWGAWETLANRAWADEKFLPLAGGTLTGPLRADVITEATFKGGIQRPYASVYVGIPAPTGLRDGTLWIVPGGSSGGGGGPSGPVLWSDIEGTPTTLSGYGITDALPQANPTATGVLTVDTFAKILTESALIGGNGNDVILRNVQGTGWQELRLTDDATAANRGFLVRESNNSGGAWSEVFRVTGNHLRWKGVDIATQTWASEQFAPLNHTQDAMTVTGTFSNRLGWTAPFVNGMGSAQWQSAYNVLSANSQAASTAGAIVIKTNIRTGESSTMFVVHVVGRLQNSGVLMDAVVGGYAQTNGTVSQPSCSMRIVGFRPTVRLGRDPDGALLIIFGDVADTWSYPRLLIPYAGGGFSGTDAHVWDNWTLEFRTDLSAVTNLTTASDTSNAQYLNGENAAYYRDLTNATGTLADARLSSNVPLKNTANTFTQTQTIGSGAGSRLILGNPTNDNATLLVGRRALNPSIQASGGPDDYLMLEGGAPNGRVSINHYGTGNIFLANGGGGVGIGKATLTAGYLLDVEGSVRWTGTAVGGILRSDTIEELTLKGGIRRPYASVYVGIPAPTGLRDGTLWIVPGGSPGGGGGVTLPILWDDIEGAPETATRWPVVAEVAGAAVAGHTHAQIDVEDIRNTPSLPNNTLSRSVQAFFSDDVATGRSWDSILSVTGWSSGSYATWQLIGPSNLTLPVDHQTLFFRAGLAGSWGTLEKFAFQSWVTTGFRPVSWTPTAVEVGAPPTSRTITAGTGLSGGGSLAANRTLSIDRAVVDLWYKSASYVPSSAEVSAALRTTNIAVTAPPEDFIVAGVSVQTTSPSGAWPESSTGLGTVVTFGSNLNRNFQLWHPKDTGNLYLRHYHSVNSQWETWQKVLTNKGSVDIEGNITIGGAIRKDDAMISFLQPAGAALGARVGSLLVSSSYGITPPANGARINNIEISASVINAVTGALDIRGQGGVTMRQGASVLANISATAAQFNVPVHYSDGSNTWPYPVIVFGTSPTLPNAANYPVGTLYIRHD